MIEAHSIRELFIEGVSVTVHDFTYLIWESLMNKNHKFYFEYYLDDNKIKSVTFKSSNITSVRICNRLVGLKAKCNDGKRVSALFLLMYDGVMHPHESEIFCNLARSHGVSNHPCMGSIENFRNYHFYGEKPPEYKELTMFDKEAKVQHFNLTFVRSYIKLLISHPMNKEECKNYFEGLKIFSDFFENLTETGWVFIRNAVNHYRDTHECGYCGKFSQLKCGKCFSVNYCSSNCQRSDWKDHKKECSKEKGEIAMREPIRLQEYFEEINKRPLIGYQDFKKISLKHLYAESRYCGNGYQDQRYWTDEKSQIPVSDFLKLLEKKK